MTVTEIFASFIKLGPFCKQFTNIDPTKGLYHRSKGYNTAGKPADLTDDDKAELKKGLISFSAEIKTVIKSL